jgi:hypothetical protein
VLVEEIAALAAFVETVKAECRHDFGQLGIEILSVKLEVLPVTLLHKLRQIKGHHVPSASSKS